jgi:KaiC/GvpD/RAD55 family RecA-like ATPase
VPPGGYCERCDLHEAVRPFGWEAPEPEIPRGAKAPVGTRIVEPVRYVTGIAALDACTGGGFVVGSVYVLAGNEGTLKSTLAQTIAGRLEEEGVVYCTTEESRADVARRAQRIRCGFRMDLIADEFDLHVILERAHGSRILILDSLQEVDMAPTVALKMLRRWAKAHKVTVLVVGKLTHDGHVRGGKDLVYDCDCMIMLEKMGDEGDERRALRVSKNRNGRSGVWGILHGDAGFVDAPSGGEPIEFPAPISPIVATARSTASGATAANSSLLPFPPKGRRGRPGDGGVGRPKHPVPDEK